MGFAFGFILGLPQELEKKKKKNSQVWTLPQNKTITSAAEKLCSRFKIKHTFASGKERIKKSQLRSKLHFRVSE